MVVGVKYLRPLDHLLNDYELDFVHSNMDGIDKWLNFSFKVTPPW